MSRTTLSDPPIAHPCPSCGAALTGAIDGWTACTRCGSVLRLDGAAPRLATYSERMHAPKQAEHFLLCLLWCS